VTIFDLEPSDPTHLGSYELLGRLGAGGMGVVYLAQTLGGAKVAVKALHVALLHEPGFLIRFGREVDALRRVNVAGTARVLDADLTTHPPYLVTEFLDGEPLDDRVRRAGTLPVSEVRALVAGLAETLVVLGAHGLVHRDVKPSNVLLTSSGPKLLDFGIAAAFDETSLTGTGLIVGSAGWLAPEQIQGTAETAATDVFALGCLAVFAATGQPPFGRGRPEIYAARLMSQPPDLQGVPAELTTLLSSMLAKDAAARPTAAAVLAGAGGGAVVPEVTRVLRTPDTAQLTAPGPKVVPTIGPPPVPRRRGVRVLVVATVIAAAAGALAYVVGHDRTVSQRSATHSPSVPKASASPSPSPSPSPAPAPARSKGAAVPFTPSASNPFRSEVWGDGTVSFTRPVDTSYSSVTLKERTLGPVTFLAPEDWASADESVPSDHSDVVLYDPTNAAARVEVSASSCVGCIQDQHGKVDPQGPLPAGTVSSFVFDRGLSAGFQEHSADGYAVNGVLTALGTRQSPEGYAIVRLALPSGDTELARRILNGIRHK
jgi:serine/threonine protein kinase